MKSHLLREFIRASLNESITHSKKTKTKRRSQRSLVNELRVGDIDQTPDSAINTSALQDADAYKAEIDSFLNKYADKIGDAADYYQNLGPTSLYAAPLLKDLYREAAKIDVKYVTDQSSFPAAIAVLTYKVTNTWSDLTSMIYGGVSSLASGAWKWVKSFFLENAELKQGKRKNLILESDELLSMISALGAYHKNYETNVDRTSAILSTHILDSYVASGGSPGDFKGKNAEQIAAMINNQARSAGPASPLNTAWKALSGVPTAAIGPAAGTALQTAMVYRLSQAGAAAAAGATNPTVAAAVTAPIASVGPAVAAAAPAVAAAAPAAAAAAAPAAVAGAAPALFPAIKGASVAAPLAARAAGVGASTGTLGSLWTWALTGGTGAAGAAGLGTSGAAAGGVAGTGLTLGWIVAAIAASIVNAVIIFSLWDWLLPAWVASDADFKPILDLKKQLEDQLDENLLDIADFFHTSDDDALSEALKEISRSVRAGDLSATDIQSVINATEG